MGICRYINGNPANNKLSCINQRRIFSDNLSFQIKKKLKNRITGIIGQIDPSPSDSN